MGMKILPIFNMFFSLKKDCRMLEDLFDWLKMLVKPSSHCQDWTSGSTCSQAEAQVNEWNKLSTDCVTA